MDLSNVLTLIGKTYTVDELLQQVPVETRRTVFCNLRSVSRAEWSAAGQMGLKPELVATMFAPDYAGEEIAEISVAGVSEAQYLVDAEGQQLLDAQRQLLRGAAKESPAKAGAVIRYGVYRTYRGRDETIELYLERKAGVTNG